MKWKQLALQITQSRRPISVTDEKNVYVPHVVTIKMSKLKIQNYEKKYIKTARISMHGLNKKE